MASTITAVDANTSEIAETLTEFEVDGSTAALVTNEEDGLSSADRIKQRLDRFGTVAPEAKKIGRALRFGTPHEAINGAAKKRRLERFGPAPHSQEEEQLKKRKRADRFYLSDSSSTTPGLTEETKKKRVERFGVVLPKSTNSSANNKRQRGQQRSNTTTNSITSDAAKKRLERFGGASKISDLSNTNEQKEKRSERFKTVESSV